MTKKADQVASLRGKLGALQQRYDEDTRFFYHEKRIHEEEQAYVRSCWYLLDTALGLMERYEHDKWIELAAEALRARLKRADDLHKEKLEKLKREYEATKKS